ncbi:MAG: hypothetical protein RLZZ473_512 [Pseudomonadota bacterium]|jgi:hypothetical protein
MTRAHPERVRGYLQHIVEAIDRAVGMWTGWMLPRSSVTPAHRTL